MNYKTFWNCNCRPRAWAKCLLLVSLNELLLESTSVYPTQTSSPCCASSPLAALCEYAAHLSPPCALCWCETPRPERPRGPCIKHVIQSVCCYLGLANIFLLAFIQSAPSSDFPNSGRKKKKNFVRSWARLWLLEPQKFPCWASERGSESGK